MASKESVQITARLLDRDYQLSCPPNEQQTLLNAASLFDKEMREIKASGRVMGVDRIAVMAGLNICYELLQLKANGGGGQGDLLTEGKLKDMQERIDAALAKANETSEAASG